MKCNDQNPDYAKNLDKYEKEIIIPKLNITRNSNILDIGCGVGRLADDIVPICNYYLGTDFAEDLISIAKKDFLIMTVIFKYVILSILYTIQKLNPKCHLIQLYWQVSQCI